MTDWIAVCMEQYASEIPMEAWYDLPQKEPHSPQKCANGNHTEFPFFMRIPKLFLFVSH